MSVVLAISSPLWNSVQASLSNSLLKTNDTSLPSNLECEYGLAETARRKKLPIGGPRAAHAILALTAPSASAATRHPEIGYLQDFDPYGEIPSLHLHLRHPHHPQPPASQD